MRDARRALRSLLAPLALALAVALPPVRAEALAISTRYRSPRNPERKVRSSTELIVLHTTEAPERSSLNKLCDRGEAHYCVTAGGSVYAIVDRDREAFHAGRSMWKGKEDVDKFSVGIECVGYHDKAMPLAQLNAIRELVKDLQRMYRLADDCVVCHSHVAYGAPNKWQKRRHRGRKRCGMLFAMPSVRRLLDLKARPAVDADTRAGRLTVGDDYLKKVLYGGIDTMGANYAKANPGPSAGTGSGWFASLLGSGGQSAESRPKASATAAKAARKVSSPPRSVAQLKARGYVMRGQVTAGNTASKIAGARWNAADTFYTIRGKVIPGDRIDEAHIEKGMCVWLKK